MSQSSYFCCHSRLYAFFFFDLERKPHFPSILDCIYYTNPQANTQILQVKELRDEGYRECACIRERWREEIGGGENCVQEG